MEPQELTELAARGGRAVVHAMGQGEWPAWRGPLARWFGQGDAQAESFWARRLQDTADVLADGAERARFAAVEQEIWQERLRQHLERLERRAGHRPVSGRAADGLRALIADIEHHHPGTPRPADAPPPSSATDPG